MKRIKQTTLLLLLINSTHNYAATPGVTAGEFSVDASGSANYQIPIAVPPGTSGMQPSLTLSYNSRSGNGLLGVGWTLGGLSAITRCPTTQVQDGFIDGIDFDSNDRFCIDGQRLIQVTGTAGQYGNDGIEYRTEVDGFTQVISYDTDVTNNGPEYFVAKTKSGQILEYGNTTDSRIEAEGKTDARLWAVNKIQDTVGNYLTVTYSEDATNGSYKPTQIDYTGNDSASPILTPNTQVQFEYETRADTPTLYFAGSKVKNTERLTNIKTYSNSTLVRDYQLTYDNNGAANRSRLTQLQECDGQTTPNCFRSITFEWQDGADGTFGSLVLTTYGPGLSYTPSAIHFVDVNGDGVADLNYVNATKVYTHLANGDGTFDSVIFQAYGSGLSYTPSAIHFVDVNGDGVADLNYVNATKVYTHLANGDGTFDSVIFQAYGPGLSYTPSAIRFVDVNGDGLTDISYTNMTKAYTHLLSGFPPDLVTKAKTSLSNETTITYTPITDSSVYTKGSNAVYPEVDIQGPVYVVSKVTVEDGIGGTRDTDYTYTEAKSSVDGRGFLGFKTMSATDSSTGIKTTTTYKQTHPYIGLVERTEQRLSNNDLLGEVETTFANKQTHTGIETDTSHPGVLFPYADTVTKKDYELGGTP